MADSNLGSQYPFDGSRSSSLAQNKHLEIVNIFDSTRFKDYLFTSELKTSN